MKLNKINKKEKEKRFKISISSCYLFGPTERLIVEDHGTKLPSEEGEWMPLFVDIYAGGKLISKCYGVQYFHYV